MPKPFVTPYPYDTSVAHDVARNICNSLIDCGVDEDAAGEIEAICAHVIRASRARNVEHGYFLDESKIVGACEKARNLASEILGEFVD